MNLRQFQDQFPPLLAAGEFNLINNPVHKVWLITGAAGALGQPLVSSVLARGDECIALDRNQRALNKLHDSLAQLGTPPALYPLDLTGAGPDDYQNLAEAIQEQFGRLDYVVHAAAHFTALRPLEHQPAEEWFTIVQTGLTGPQLLNAAVMPLLRAGERGTIAFVNNTACLENPAHWGAYGVCQAGRRQMVASLASELGPLGPRAIEVDPGPFFSSLRSAAWPTDSPKNLASAETAAGKIFRQLGSGD
jgi:NAD(P)-dependent dehydrogenase (short-subunit alcohol dehydrogenase family)